MYKSTRYVATLYTLLCVGAVAATGAIALTDSVFNGRPALHGKPLKQGIRDACLLDNHVMTMQFNYGNAV
ncbi:exported protein of unknown function [Pararobbsia alpina]|uniref:hypothetical protein n=1 Tax=Pararobbsia alpina TaxID=621374 RepID=UPI0039A6308D